MNGGACIAAVLEHLKPEDVQLLLANRGLPSVGPKEDLTDCLQVLQKGLTLCSVAPGTMGSS